MVESLTYLSSSIYLEEAEVLSCLNGGGGAKARESKEGSLIHMGEGEE